MGGTLEVLELLARVLQFSFQAFQQRFIASLGGIVHSHLKVNDQFFQLRYFTFSLVSIDRQHSSRFCCIVAHILDRMSFIEV